jgi:hypothetical protein
VADNAPLSGRQGKPQRHYPFFVKCMAAVVSVLLTLLVLEVGVRVTFALRGIDIRSYQPSFIYAQGDSTRFDRSRFISHPFLPYAPRPYDTRKLYVYREAIQRVLEFDITNNSLGFRTPERPFEKTANIKRIITLGGSTTWEGPANDATWPALLEKKLNAHYDQTGDRVEVINLSVDMASSPMSLVNLAFTGLEYHPDLVISCDGVNDSFLIGFEGETPDYRSTMDRYDDHIQPLQARLPNWAFRSYLISVASKKYDSLSQARPDLYGQVIANKTSQLKPAANPLAGVQYFERNLRSMRAIARENKARFVASTAHWSEPPPKIEAMNSDLRDFFQRNQIDYLDLDELLRHHDSSIHTDAVHWTEKGLDQVAEQWKTKIISADLLGLNRRGN